MSENRDIFSTAAELSGSGTPFVLVTVVGTKGSTPRDAGARMIWRPENGSGGGQTGTVGGGQFEALVLDAAAKCYEKRACGLERFVLGADADQCCGGVMEVFLEYQGPGQRLVLFGAGHVSGEIAALVEGAWFQTVIVDDRPEWNAPGRFPRAQRIAAWDQGIAMAQEHPGATMACVMTCSHDTDFEVLRKLLEHPPAFTGLIGSRSKRACLLGRLVASGLDEGIVQAVHCPIGVGDTGKEPRLVAISIAAQLLMEAKRLACL